MSMISHAVATTTSGRGWWMRLTGAAQNRASGVRSSPRRPPDGLACALTIAAEFALPEMFGYGSGNRSLEGWAVLARVSHACDAAPRCPKQPTV
jgi:hypothetical protein